MMSKKNLMSTGTKLRKAFLFVLGLWALADTVYSQPPIGPGPYMSEAVYTTSFTCANSQIHSVWISSPSPASLYAIKVSSVGSGDAKFSIYDGIGSTAAVDAKLVDTVNARVQDEWFYEVKFSSWLGVHNHSKDGNPACLTIIYRKR